MTLVSVLMPTYGQAAFLPRALESLRAQSFVDWELIVLDDGSLDDTASVLQPFLSDERIRYQRRERNGGLGAALNDATAAAQGRYLAYLPSDDLFYPEHLARLVAVLESQPEAYLAYGGLRYKYERYGEAPETGPVPGSLRMVQVLHRRDHEPQLRWPTRAERESDELEGEFWAQLAERGASVYAGALSCEWLDHAEQRSKLIAGGSAGGLSRYRAHYGVGRGEWINWQPSHGPRSDERARYGRFAVPRELPASDGLRILLVGELGFNPERIMAFEERGHQLFGLWTPRPQIWDTAGPLPYGNVEVVPYDQHWPERVRALQPDVIYALLNWQAVALIDEVLEAGLDIPAVFHFKEGPMLCYELGLWPAFVRILRRAAGHVFINEESRDWVQLALGELCDPAHTLLIDGDLPKADWLTNDWAPKLSAGDGQIHTVCPGRPLGMDPFEEIARAGIHVHFYGEQFHQITPNWVRTGLPTGHMHLHPAVEPAQWVRELSQYDAGWLHLYQSPNGGDLRRALWDDLNYPARLSTYATAGLPWIMRDNRGATVATQRLAEQLDVGLFFDDFAGLAAQLRERARLEQLTANMRAARGQFAFDSHVDALINLFQRVSAGK